VLLTASLTPELELPRCPHCSVDTPRLRLQHQFETSSHHNQNRRYWRIYSCARCGGVVTASATNGFDHPVCDLFPAPPSVEQDVPDRARNYLEQAIASIHAPAGAVMLTASAVDAMLKSKGLTEGSLYSRIEQATKNHLITDDMNAWAHDVRLDANDQRHADDAADLPSEADAKRAIDFARGLALVLFVLPARVQRGRQDAKRTG
jgi:hypothetical protein